MGQHTKQMKIGVKQNAEDQGSIRINRYLSEAGICSRREADKKVEAGQVQVDGVTALPGTKVMPGQVVTIMGQPVAIDPVLEMIVYHKPVGVECTANRSVSNNIIDRIGYEKRIYPVGRLDKDSRGLILLTNDGKLSNSILKAGNCHEKEYVVYVNKPITAGFIKSMGQGVPVLDRISAPCTVTQVGKYSFRIILIQGMNRQIRRMCEYLGYRITDLQRVRIMNIHLGNLKEGSWRVLSDAEIQGLQHLVKAADNFRGGGKSHERKNRQD